MTVIEIIDLFTFYGIDVILLAALTAILVQIFKKTLLKKLNKKLITFLPFALGTFLYAAYTAALNLSLVYLVTEYVSVLEHGFSVGATATLLYVLYEQFVRENVSGLTATEGTIATLIDGYVPAKSVNATARLIASAIEKDVTGDGAKLTADILAKNAGKDVTEQNIQLLSKLIIETLAHLNNNS